MRRLCCCPRSVVAPSPTHALALDLVADLPPHTRDSSALTSYEDGDTTKNISAPKERPNDTLINGPTSEVKILAEEEAIELPPPTPRSISLRVEDYSERSTASPSSIRSRLEVPQPVIGNAVVDAAFGEQRTYADTPQHNSLDSTKTALENSPERVSSTRPTPTPTSSLGPSPSRSLNPSPDRSRNPSPDPVSDVYEAPRPTERDVRTALAECIVPARHEDWEVIVSGLVETERLAADPAARAPAASWRAVTRSAAVHVRSLRSRVARAACCTIGALFEHRGRALDPELDEAAGALLERCADVNRFLRADAADALVRLASGGSDVRAVATLARRGACHRAGPVRAAAASALARLVAQGGAARALALPPDTRSALLRAAGELLADANADARLHARNLCLALGEDVRFRQMLKEAMPPSRYRAIEKLVDKLRCR